MLNKIRSLTIMLLSLLLTISYKPTTAALVEYGDTCRTSEDFANYQYWDYSESDLNEGNFDICNFANGLCINNTCICSNTTIMIYNEKLNECGIPTGDFCNQNESDHTCFSGNECIDSQCTCQSPRESIVLDDGTIKCSNLRQEVCSIDKECSSIEFLSCFEGFCDCKSPMRTLFEDTGISKGCKIRAGESCIPDFNLNLTISHQQCVSNSICTNNTNSKNKHIFSHGIKRQSASLANYICTCQKGYYPTPDGECKKEHLQPCTPSFQECHSYKGLTCKNAECVCVDEDTCYDKEQGKCVSYVGQPCGLFSLWYDEYDIGCFQNAECVLEDERIDKIINNISTPTAANNNNNKNEINSSSLRKICKCKPGFIEEFNNADGKQCVQKNSTQVISSSSSYTSTSTTTIANNVNATDYDYSEP